jgi:hypothetical protein
MTCPLHAAAPEAKSVEGGESDLSGRLIGSSYLAAGVKFADPRVFMARETVCPYSCSFSSSACPFRCAPVSLRDSEVRS